MSVSKRLRYEVLRRDDHACRYCGAKAPDVKLTVDHVIPSALGGTDKPENLVTACSDCIRADDRKEVIDEWSEVWRWPFENGPHPEVSARADYHRDGNWRHSIGRFLDAGLTARELVDMADDTLSRQRLPNERVWKYFCGMCWNAVEARQDEARRLIKTGVF